MNAPTHYDPNPVVRQQQNPHSLHIRQQPEKGRVVLRGKEKERKPLDPPPILQLNVPGDNTFLHNPYLFCTCQLWHAEEDKPAENPEKMGGDLKDGELLLGQLVSSLHRLKDLDNTDKGFFVFGDLSVALIGRFRLKFVLWEYGWIQNNAVSLTKEISNVFEVIAAKEWDGIRESTSLSRTIADQGIKLRLRKESRHPRGRPVEGASTGSASSAPLRPHPSIQQDGGPGMVEQANKRQRSYGTESGSAGSSMATTPYANAPYASTATTPSNYSAYASPGQHPNMQPQYYQPSYPGYPQQSYNYTYPNYPVSSNPTSYRQPTQSDQSNSYNAYGYSQSGQQYMRSNQPYPAAAAAEAERTPTSYQTDSSSYGRSGATGGIPAGSSWASSGYNYGALPSLTQGTSMADGVNRLPPISSDPRAPKQEQGQASPGGQGYAGYPYNSSNQASR